MWKFSRFFTARIIIPIYLFLYIIILFLLYFDDKETFGKDAIIVSFVFFAMTVLAFFILALTGLTLYARHNFRQDDTFFHQNNRKLEKNNLLKIDIGRIGSIYCAAFIPKKNGLFKSCKLVYYFYNYPELVEFLTKNCLIPYLGVKEKNWISANKLLKGCKLQEDGYLVIERYPCPCCGYLTYPVKPGGTFDICPVCFWEDDELSLDCPEKAFDVNKVSLHDARINYRNFKACKREFINCVREPAPCERPESENVDEAGDRE